MRARRLLALLLASLLGALACAAAGHEVWWTGVYSISRFDALSATLRRADTDTAVRALAPAPGGGAWIAQDDRLVRVDADLQVVAVAALPLDPATPVRLAAIADGGAWVAQGSVVRRLDAFGVVIGGWSHAKDVSALVHAGPSAIFVADDAGVTRYDAREWPARVVTVAPAEGVARDGLMLDAGAGYVWVLAGDTARQLDILAGLAERARVSVAEGTAAVAIDARTGTLWLLGRDSVTRIDRSGIVAGRFDVPRDAMVQGSSMAADTLAERLWIGDLRGASVLDTEALQWIRLSASDAVVSIAGAFSQVLPTLVIDPASSAEVPRLAAGASCAGIPCRATPRYLSGLRLRATAGAVDVADRLALDPVTGVVEVVDSNGVLGDGRSLVTSITDSYGNRSSELVVDTSYGHEARSTLRPQANQAPTVSVTAPVNNASFVAPATIAITATAADADGTIAKVEFYRDGVLLGTDTTSPYSYSWTNVAIGTYKVTAKAYDNAGATTTSAIVTVKVNANVAPAVSITAPANNSAYTAPATIAITASASDGDGTVKQVDFYQGSTKIGSSTTSPYAFTWTNVAGATYSLTAKATDDKGAVTTSRAVTVKVNKPPTVSLTAPADNAVVVGPASVTISATAADADGTIAKVEFFRNGTLIGTDTTSPYSFVWSAAPLGTYSLTAKATDNSGASTTSVARTLTIRANQAPSVSLTAPANGATVIEGAPVTVSAMASDPDGTIAKVDFYREDSVYGLSLAGSDTTAPYGVTTTLRVGQYKLTAVAKDNNGTTTTSAPVTVTVVPNQYPTIQLLKPLDGQVFAAMSPPDIALEATASDLDGSVASVTFYYIPGPTPEDPEPAPVLIEKVTTPPYRAVWRGVPFTRECADIAGCPPPHYDVMAEVMDNAGGGGDAFARIHVVEGSPWTLALLAPVEDSVMAAPATVVIVTKPVTDVVSTVTVSKVEFFGDGVLVGSVTGAPNGANGEYVATWRNVGAGARVVSARLTDSAGWVVGSSERTVSVRGPNQAPVPRVIADVTQTVMFPPLGAPTAGTMRVSATDADGSISLLEAIFDDASTGSGPTSPLTATTPSITEGVHTMAARATDDAGASALSKPVFARMVSAYRLLAVVMTRPAPGPVTNPVEMVVDAKADAGLAKVRFFDGANQLGFVESPPYRFTATLSNGAHTLTARAVMHDGHEFTSTPVVVNVSGANIPPNVTLTSPTSGQTFTLGSTVPLAVTTSDPDGTVVGVDYAVDSVWVASPRSPPFSGSFVASSVGSHFVSARATDNQGGERTSAQVSINVVANTPPVVSLTTPTAGQTIYAGVPTTLTASASDPGGAVAKVEFFAGATSIGTVSAAPYTLTWTPAAAGTVALSAKATDNAGATTTSAAVSVTVIANGVPSVALVMPRPAQTFVTGGTITLVATASDPEGGIAKVEFYAGSTLLASLTAAPYAYEWKNVATGNYALTAKVTDTRGASVASAPVGITVKPLGITVTSPVANSSIPTDMAFVTGSYTAPENSGILVNGVVATTDGKGKFFVNNLPLEAGANTLTLTLTTLSGETVTQTLAVTSTGDAPFVVVADPVDGEAPLRVALRYSNRGLLPTTFGVSDLGSGSWDTSALAPGQLGALTFPAPGVYFPKVTLYYGNGQVYTQTFGVLVRDAASMNTMFMGMLSDFKAALGAEQDRRYATSEFEHAGGGLGPSSRR